MRLLERHSARAPLALECRDGVTGVPVTDGLRAVVWWRDEPAQRYSARRSPLSGMLGVGVLPGLRLVQVGPAGEADGVRETGEAVRVVHVAAAGRVGEAEAAASRALACARPGVVRAAGVPPRADVGLEPLAEDGVGLGQRAEDVDARGGEIDRGGAVIGEACEGVVLGGGASCHGW